MAAIKFILQSKKNPSNIYVRVMLKDRDLKRKTGYVIDPRQWNPKKGYPKKVDSLHAKLYALQKKISESLNHTDNPDGGWLEGAIKDSPKMLSEMIQDYLDSSGTILNSQGQPGLSHNRVKNMRSFKQLILRYGDTANVDLEYCEGLKKWMSGYSKNYISKTLENVKTIMRHAGIVDHKVFLMKTPWEKTEVVILTLEELDHIKSVELGERLSNVRKWLLFGCYTGQRASDLFGIREEHIKTLKGKKIIELEQQKTKRKVVIPLIPDALDTIVDGFPKPISIQKFNGYLKELMKECGIDKHITSHCMRRSFASNFYGTIPTPLIMSITGHVKESSFLTYIGRSAYDNALSFLDYFG